MLWVLSCNEKPRPKHPTQPHSDLSFVIGIPPESQRSSALLASGRLALARGHSNGQSTIASETGLYYGCFLEGLSVVFGRPLDWQVAFTEMGWLSLATRRRCPRLHCEVVLINPVLPGLAVGAGIACLVRSF